MIIRLHLIKKEIFVLLIRKNLILSLLFDDFNVLMSSMDYRNALQNTLVARMLQSIYLIIFF